MQVNDLIAPFHAIPLIVDFAVWYLSLTPLQRMWYNVELLEYELNILAFQMNPVMP